MSELSDIIDALKPVSTATITTVLIKHGLRRVWMRGTRPNSLWTAARCRARIHLAFRSSA